jgi:6-phosphofructokinase 2
MDGEEGEEIAGRRLETRAETADFASELVARSVARRVIVARGADGNVLAEAGGRLFAPAPRVRVKSTVGAGDSFVAAFVLALARGQDSAAALSMASAAAAAAVMTDATQLCRAEDVMRLMPEAQAAPI